MIKGSPVSTLSWRLCLLIVVSLFIFMQCFSTTGLSSAAQHSSNINVFLDSPDLKAFLFLSSRQLLLSLSLFKWASWCYSSWLSQSERRKQEIKNEWYKKATRQEKNCKGISVNRTHKGQNQAMITKSSEMNSNESMKESKNQRRSWKRKGRRLDSYLFNA